MMSANGQDVYLEALVEKSPWGVEVVIGTRLSMEFGNEVIRQRHKRPHGEWHLLFKNCHWRIENASSVIVGSDDHNLSETVTKLTFGKVSAVRFVSPSNDLEMNFSNNLRLRTFLSHSSLSSESKQWYLFGPDESVLVADGGNLLRKNRNES